MPKFWNIHWSDRLRRELSLRHYSDRTIQIYQYVLKSFLDFNPGDPRNLKTGNLKAYLEHLDQRAGLSASTRNLHRDALAFFFRNVLSQPQIIENLPRAKGPQKLPDVLSPHEILVLLDAAGTPKQRLMLAFAYGCGLRVSELAHLRSVSGKMSGRTSNLVLHQRPPKLRGSWYFE